jgi:signal transduction histidine kinase
MSALLSGALVSLGGWRSRLNRVYAIFSGLLAIWSGALGWALIAVDPEWSLFLFRVEHASVVFIPTLYLHVVLLLIEHEHQEKKILYTMYGSSILLFVSNAAGFLIIGVRPDAHFSFYKEPGTLYPFLLLVFIFTLSYAFYLLYVTYRKRPGHQRNRIIFFFIASVIGFAGGLPTFLPLYGIYPWPFIMYVTPIFYFVIAYAIVKYRLMDIALTLSKSASYVLTLLFGIAPVLVVLFFIQRVLPLTASITFILILASILTVLFQKIHPLSVWLVQNKLHRVRTNYYQILRKFSDDMVAAVNMGELQDRFEATLRQTMQVTSVALYLVGPWHRRIPTAGNDPSASLDEPRTLAPHSDVIPVWTSSHALLTAAYEAKDVLVLGEMELMAREKENKLLDEAIIQMREARAEVCIPFKRDAKMLGIALLGPREGNRYYSPEDLGLLHSIGQNACVAVQNALLIEESKRSLKLLYRSQRLAAMDSLINEMGHKIRSPLTVIQLALDSIEDGKSGGRQRLPIRTAMRRMTNVLDEAYALAAEYKPEFAQDDVNRVLEEAVDDIGPQIREKELRVQRLYERLPEAMIDAARLKQALFEILLNAIEASPKGGALLLRAGAVTLKQGAVPWPRQGIRVEIADEGCGISPENLERVFDPFFTTKFSSHAREAAGLGLSIAHRVAEEHGGAIELRSELGKGTTAIVTLPAERDG